MHGNERRRLNRLRSLVDDDGVKEAHRASRRRDAARLFRQLTHRTQRPSDDVCAVDDALERRVDDGFVFGSSFLGALRLEFALRLVLTAKEHLVPGAHGVQLRTARRDDDATEGFATTRGALLFLSNVRL